MLDQIAHRSLAGCLLFAAIGLLSTAAVAQPAPGAPPAVGVTRAERQQLT